MGQLPPLAYGGTPGVPGPQPLVVGAVTFPSWSCPATITLGSVEQKIVINELLGGGRVIQALGVQPKSVEFSAELWGDQVSSLVQDMTSYVVSGLPQTVTFLNQSWSCIVKEFEPTYQFQWRCGYKLVLEPANSTTGVLQSTAIVTVDEQVSGTISQINTLVNQIDSQALAQGFGPVSILWQDVLIALGVLYELEQINF